MLKARNRQKLAKAERGVSTVSCSHTAASWTLCSYLIAKCDEVLGVEGFGIRRLRRGNQTTLSVREDREGRGRSKQRKPLAAAKSKRPHVPIETLRHAGNLNVVLKVSCLDLPGILSWNECITPKSVPRGSG